MRKRIAMISEHASPLAALGGVDSGGQNIYVAQVSAHLAAAGHAVDVFTRRDREAQPAVVEVRPGMRVIHVPAGPPTFIRKEDLLPCMGAFSDCMIRALRERHYDLMHANFWMSALVAADVKRVLSLPYVITFHALGRVRRQHQQAADGFPACREAIEERVIREADRVIAECPQDRDDLLTLYGADPATIATIPCGFDPREFWPVPRATARRMLGMRQAERIILQLGRLVPRKGIDNVIRALGLLQSRHDLRATLWVVGGESEDADPVKTPEIGRLRGVAREAGVADQVVFSGRVDRPRLKLYYSAADVFVTTPWYEPFGITPLEAMACGTPVIGASVGGIKYTVQDGITGFLVPPRDPEALADRLARCYREPELLQRFRRAGLRRVTRRFTWRRVAAAIDALYDSVLAPAPALSLMGGWGSVRSSSWPLGDRVPGRLAAE
jgi:glycosyltransferase involved in cell wall biosynthesis